MRPVAFASILAFLSATEAFLHPSPSKNIVALIQSKSSTVTETINKVEASSIIPPPKNHADRTYWRVGSTLNYPNPSDISSDLMQALETQTHPVESQSELGKGIFVTDDWRKGWHTYQSPVDAPGLIDPNTGYAEYEILPQDIEGELPDDLVGVLYRNGPGKFGVGDERVAHALDADGLITKISISPSVDEHSIGNNKEHSDEEYKRKVMFQSRFVETKAFVEEREANKFLYRGTFGTAPRGPDFLFGKSPKKGLNEDPPNIPLLNRIAGNAFKTNIKNPANTQVISFGGKLLALFEAGLPHAIDPETLDTLGEYDMGGVLLKDRLPVKLGLPFLEEYSPDFIGGAAHTAHPNVCPKTGNLVGWHWSVLSAKKSLEVTFTEWAPKTFESVSSSTFELSGCELAPHDMAMTDNYIILKVNALSMNQAEFLSGISGPAASLKMDGRANVVAHVFPRPSSSRQFKPFQVEVPPCFSIHFSHAYEDSETGNIVSFFSGWPPSDSTDFLGSWGGFAPDFKVIPQTYLWRMEIDPNSQKCVDLRIAPGCSNIVTEHPLVHPNFVTRKAQNVYSQACNNVGDSSPPCGFGRFRVESGSRKMLEKGVANNDVDIYWFGTRYFVGENIIVPKRNGDLENENEAYLLGMVHDASKDRSFLAIFDLERELKEGPVCKLWLKSAVPHGLHGCFAPNGPGESSVFC